MANTAVVLPGPIPNSAGSLVIPAGTVLAPALQIGTGLNGLYAPSTSSLAVTTTGTQAMLWDASDNTTIPAGSAFIWSGRAQLQSPADGSIRMLTNAGTTVANMDVGGYVVPNVIDPSTYYTWTDWDANASTGTFTQNGNVVLAAVNSVSAPLMNASNMGVAYVNTSSTTAGGYLALPAALALIKSSTITYQWRHIFYLPTLSSSTNRYTAYAGSFICTGTANNANAGPFAGPFIKYSDNVNSGNWVLGSAVAGTQTVANSSTAAVAGWHSLTISLANGVYTFTLDGVSLGTVTDANITTSPANNQSASVSGIAIFPDGTNFTTQRTLMIDRSDFYVTGLSR